MKKIRYKIFWAASIFLLTISISSCIPVPDVQSGFGIRVTTSEQLAGMPGVSVPVANCGYAGILNAILGPGSGSDSAITGRTGANGIADNPNARTNASWTVSVTFPIPACVFSPLTGDVPDAGAAFNFICIL